MNNPTCTAHGLEVCLAESGSVPGCCSLSGTLAFAPMFSYRKLADAGCSERAEHYDQTGFNVVMIILPCCRRADRPQDEQARAKATGQKFLQPLRELGVHCVSSACRISVR